MHDAIAILRSAGVVGIPTETVYGLAADARSDSAVAEIFRMKGRPATNPLIVHVASVAIGRRYATFDDRAKRLFATLSPGPLTIVLPVAEPRSISPLVTAGLKTVGIRIPAHPIALTLLAAFDGPLAAPSANKSNHISPTTAEHVRGEFADGLLVLDGGSCSVGVESTVLDLSGATPTILRPGAVSQAQIEAVIGPVDTFVGHVGKMEAAASPGQHEKHYAPRAPAWRFTRGDRSPNVLSGAALLWIGEQGAVERWDDITTIHRLPDDPAGASHDLYATLRAIDAAGPSEIFIEMPPDRPEWTAVRDRIRRATRPLPARSAL